MTIVVYLLHFQSKVRCSTHYLGSTTVRNYRRRMREHARGSGAKLSTIAFEQGVPFKVARCWLSDGRQLERKLKRSSHFKRLCPICRRELQIPPAQPEVKLDLTGLATGDFRGIGF